MMKIFGFVAVLCSMALAADPPVVYISPFGADAPGRGGSLSDPFLSLSYAYSRVGNQGQINVERGTYTTSANFVTFLSSKNVTVAGYPSGSNNNQFIFDVQGSNLYMDVNGDIRFRGVTFVAATGSTSSIGIINVRSSGHARISDCSFNGASTAVSASGSLTLENLQLTVPILSSMTASGVIVNDASGRIGREIDIRNVTFRSSTVTTTTYPPQGISFSYGATATIQGVTFVGLGNAITVGASQQALTINDVRFDTCRRGIYFQSRSDSSQASLVKITGANFVNCGGAGLSSSWTQGAGIFVNGGIRLTITDSTFMNNVFTSGPNSVGQGAGLWCGGQTTINMDDCLFSNNKAADAAAGWCGTQCSFFATGTTLTNNSEDKNTGPCRGLVPARK